METFQEKSDLELQTNLNYSHKTDVSEIKLKILYDNEAKPEFEEGWGFSCLIELEEENILFDTGWDGKVLISNMKKFSIDPKNIDRIFLSHAHWDHIGGLPHIRREGMKLYVPKSFSERLRNELSDRFDLHEVEDSQEIRKGVWTTGEIENSVGEQSLILSTNKGLLVIVGCSHSGVGKILSVASEFGEIWGILGGMHDFEDYDVLKDLSFVMPTHCTENKDKISELFPEKYVEGKAGMELSLG